MRLEDLSAGLLVAGVLPGAAVSVVAMVPHGPDAVTLVFKDAQGRFGERVLYRGDEPGLSVVHAEGRPFTAPAEDFILAAEASRIRMAAMFDPMLAVATSDIRPLPHQIRAVYGELLPRTPLRFLLADDPGAGKTIMAGLFIKELLLREDVHRCLIVAPGGLVDQWQDELWFKFGLRFELFAPQLVDATLAGSVFDHHPLLIARMDQLARNDELLGQLGDSEWDLVIVDEAHRMGAHYFGAKLTKTKRFELGELLRGITRHLLLMTATPHSGKEEDFQLFLTLLDPDGFEGRYRTGVHAQDFSEVMRRMVKEDLLTFEGKPLFPERIAQTVPYELSPAEQELYALVTDYVRQGMNRADLLDGKRRTTVGFALTVLQRRLASSPEAIYQSLVRRTARLTKKRDGIRNGTWVEPDSSVEVIDDPDEYAAGEIEQVEEELVDAATAARTVEELTAELAELADLTAVARRVRESGADRKWTELRTLLDDNQIVHSPDGSARKLIVFTEHRDTLSYLEGRIGTLLGKPGAVRSIHGGVRRPERRQITEEFTKNPDCQVLIATDAAGEGLNLQAAHLMVNYDLPWNPNRIEQRFGRIHRIGQSEVCRLWNLVASSTREGEVFTRLLDKVEEQRKAYGGKVFDVLGEAFTDTPLRTLLIDAIRYGEQPEVRARMHQVIDASVAEGLQDLLAERALARELMAEADLAELRRAMDEARAQRLQPHFIERAFRAGFARLGGRIGRREAGRFEISHVPARLRTGAHGPVATRYERVTFALDRIEPDNLTRADLLAPGHPLHDAVMAETIALTGHSLDAGSVLVSATIDKPCLLVGVREEILDATGESVARRFGYAYVDQTGTVTPAGPAPHLDCVAAPSDLAAAQLATNKWIHAAEPAAVDWIIAHQLPAFLDHVRPARLAELARARQRVEDRLNSEINRLAADCAVAEDTERRGQKPKESSESLNRKIGDLEQRLTTRLARIAQQQAIATTPPRVTSAALVLPARLLDHTDTSPGPGPEEAVLPTATPVDTTGVERRAVDAVLAAETDLGRAAVEQPHNNPGFDILSHPGSGAAPIRIEVKGRIAGAPDFFVTTTEVMLGRNAAPHYRLALVSVDPDTPTGDQVRYLIDPFTGIDLGEVPLMGIRIDWAKMWARAIPPC